MPPVDAEIEAAIRAVGPLSEVPLGDSGEILDDRVLESYLDGAMTVLDPGGAAVRADLACAYTPMHGVGGDVLTRGASPGLVSARYAVVERQAAPDPDFPHRRLPRIRKSRAR